MKKTFQIITKTINAHSDLIINDKLRQDYQKCTGVFIVAGDMSGVSMNLSVAQSEVLPKGTDCNLLRFNGNYSLKETAYDFSKENLPAKSCDINVVMKNTSTNNITFSLYLILENE